MQINGIDIQNESKLIADYRKNKSEIMQFFDYHPYDSFQERVEELHTRNFKRDQLSDVLKEMNQNWDAPAATLENIEQLKDSNAVVIVGGQQAGLVTGPLYTINKIISIIQLAREQQEKLQIPVIPTFWIAGEDHDYEEINHVYMPERTSFKKIKMKQLLSKRSSVSHVSLDKKSCHSWLEELFGQLPETEHTKDLYELIMESLTKADNFTDFFGRMIFRLFEEEGLVLVDSASDAIREVESDFFVQLIENQTKISHGVANASKEIEEKGYSLSLETEDTNAHIFYHLDNERILLERTPEGNWKGKQDEVHLSTEELLEVAKSNPQYLSNNVVSRPVMQELLFPTLGFIGGPGEISYWAALKPAFQAVNIKMPPVVPRLSYTYVPRKVEKALDLTKVEVESAVQFGTTRERDEFIQTKQNPSVDDLAQELKDKIEKEHATMRKVAEGIRADIHQMAEKNLFHIHREVDFLKERMKQAIEEKYDKELEQYDFINMYLRPKSGFQERTWNPLPFLNEYGLEWIKEVTNRQVSLREKHYIVYL